MKAQQFEDEVSGLVISWVGKRGRSANLADALGYRDRRWDGGAGPAPIRYTRLAIWTARVIRETRPDVIIVMQPPVVALLCVAAFSRKRVIGDLHTGVFDDPKWSWATGITLGVLRRRGLAIVTGQQLRKRVVKAGCPAAVLHDPVVSTEDWNVARDSVSPHILVPLAYAYDEPISELINAAVLTPQIRYIWTGNAPDQVKRAAPSNIVFAGFVSTTEYRRLLQGATAVLAITTYENTMQRAGYEAMSCGVPVIYSRTEVLRDYFKESGIAVEPNSDEIARAASQVWNSYERFHQKAIQRRTEIYRMEQESIAALRREIQQLDMKR